MWAFSFHIELPYYKFRIAWVEAIAFDNRLSLVDCMGTFNIVRSLPYYNILIRFQYARRKVLHASRESEYDFFNQSKKKIHCKQILLIILFLQKIIYDQNCSTMAKSNAEEVDVSRNHYKNMLDFRLMWFMVERYVESVPSFSSRVNRAINFISI